MRETEFDDYFGPPAKGRVCVRAWMFPDFFSRLRTYVQHMLFSHIWFYIPNVARTEPLRKQGKHERRMFGSAKVSDCGVWGARGITTWSSLCPPGDLPKQHGSREIASPFDDTKARKQASPVHFLPWRQSRQDIQNLVSCPPRFQEDTKACVYTNLILQIFTFVFSSNIFFRPDRRHALTLVRHDA